MIIKLIPVKRLSSLGSIIDYIATDKGHIEDYRKVGYFNNVREIELDKLTNEFKENYTQFGKKRSNGNIAMHVILSVSPLDRGRMNLATMDSIIREYLDKAYPNALAFGATHHTQNHWHAHLLVSANEVRSHKSTRLDKATLRSIHEHMLGYVRTQHKELATNIDLANWGKKNHSEREYYKRKRNPTITLTKDELAQKVQQLFRSAESSKDFYRKLAQAKLETYDHNGQPFGIRWGEENKKLRFARLGISQEQIQLLDKQNDRLNQLEIMRQQKQGLNKERDR